MTSAAIAPPATDWRNPQTTPSISRADSSRGVRARTGHGASLSRAAVRSQTRIARRLRPERPVPVAGANGLRRILGLDGLVAAEEVALAAASADGSHEGARFAEAGRVGSSSRGCRRIRGLESPGMRICSFLPSATEMIAELGPDRFARRRVRGVSLAARGGRPADRDGGAVRSGEPLEPRDRRARPRVGPRRRVAVRRRRGADRAARAGPDRDPGSLCRLRRVERRPRVGLPGRRGRAVARSADARRGCGLGADSRPAPRRAPGAETRWRRDAGRRSRRRPSRCGACRAGACSSPSGSTRRSAPGTGCRR